MAAVERYTFGEFTLDPGERQLSRGGTAVHLAPKAFDVLAALVRDAGRLITKQALLAGIWPEVFVEEGILTVHISSLRKALGDTNRQPSFIETVSGSGYRFIAPVSRAAEEPRDRADVSRPIEAYEAVGRGRAHLLSGSYFQLPEAVAAFQQAIAIDPSYAAAHAELALARCAQAQSRSVPHLDALADAKGSALRALAMDTRCADAQVALGVVLFIAEWDWRAAERSFVRALEINPNHTEAYLHYGSLMETLGDLARGLHLKQRALERDPRAASVLTQMAVSFWNQRRYEDAIAWAKKALDADARHLFARELLAGAYSMLGDIDRFVEANVQQAEVFGVSGAALAEVTAACDSIKCAYDAEGRTGMARRMLSMMPKAHPPAAHLRFAVLYSDAGDLDSAFQHLDKALEARDPALVHLAVAPQWDGLRRDARFEQRLARMGLASVAA
jgi:DNA-binding winged helix-turn-helix (wHTH) protein